MKRASTTVLLIGILTSILATAATASYLSINNSQHNDGSHQDAIPLNFRSYTVINPFHNLSRTDLIEPLPISSTYFKTPKTYVNTYVGFAFDYEVETIMPIKPVIKLGIDPANDPYDFTSVMYQKSDQIGTSYYAGQIGFLKFTLPGLSIGNTAGESAASNVFTIEVDGCPLKGPQNCFASDAQINYADQLRSLSALTNSSLIDNHVLGLVSNIYTPNRKFSLYLPASLNTINNQNKEIAKNLFKSLLTLRSTN